MRSDAQRLALTVAVLAGAVALFVAGFLIVLGVRSVVAGPGSAPLASAPNPGHSWSEIGDLPGTMWHSNNDGSGSGLDADTLDGLQSTQIQDADDYVSNAGHANTADSATSASSASYAATAGDADTVDGLHSDEIQDADDYVSTAGYCTASGDADTLDGAHASAFAGASHVHNASDISSGTLSTDRYAAYTDLSAEGYVANEAGDLAQNNGLLQTTLNADLLDGVHANQIQDADDYVSNAGYCTTAGGADTLDGQHGAYYRSATNINAGTLGAAYYSAQSDLSAEGYLGNAAGDLAQNNGTVQATLNADLLDGVHANQIQDADDYVSTAGYCVAVGDADTLDAQHGAYYRDATNINAGTLGPAYYSAIADLGAEGYVANEAGDLAQNNGLLQTTLNADLLDGVHSNQIQDADDYVSNAGYCTTAGGADTLDGQHGAYYRDATNINAGTLGPAYYSAQSDLGAEGYLGNEVGDLAQNNGLLQATLNADLLDGVHANQIQDADDYVSTAGYCVAVGDADTLDGQHGAYYRNATNINAGTLGPGYYSAYSDLGAEGYLGNEAGDLAQNNGTLQATLNADLVDGVHASQIQDADDYVSNAAYCTAAGDADTLDGQHGAYYRNATNINAGTLGPGYYSAYGDLGAEGYLGNEAGDLAQNNGTLQATLNADLLDGLDSTAFSSPPWSAITGKPAGFADDVDNDVLGGLSCANGEVAKWDGSAWRCAADDTGTGSFWSLAGNSGTTGSNFLGTTDNQALELRVNNARALRLEPNATSANVIAGYSGNNVTAGVVGAAICGGGASTTPNRVTDDYGTVGGGGNNQAGDGAGTTGDRPNATVGGGRNNTASQQGATVGGGSFNRAIGDHATVGGGGSNEASAMNATIGGGQANMASQQYTTVSGGIFNSATANWSTVGGGSSNAATGQTATIAGGSGNTASFFFTTVGGGNSNTASGRYATVPGGQNNAAAGEYSVAAGRRAKANHTGAFVWADSTDADFASTTADQFLVRASGGVSLNVTSGALRLEPNATSANVIGGYSGNNVTAGVVGAAICGGGASGNTNRVTDGYGTVGGGGSNQAGNDDGYTMGQPYASVSGGRANTASASFATVGGGESNTASGGYASVGGGASNTASGALATVSGGLSNTASEEYTAVGGGWSNRASGLYSTIGGGYSNTGGARKATVGGGDRNLVTDESGTVGGGQFNQAGDNAGDTTDRAFATVSGGASNTASGYLATVGGGDQNTASGYAATVGGGSINTVNASYATVPGGIGNTAAGAFSFAAGRAAKANNQGCFVWGDSTDADVACNDNDRFIARASGGVYLYTSGDLSTGAYLAAGSGSWSDLSDRNLKDNFTPVNGQDVLARLAEIPVATWNYKAQDASVRHMGPVAQDFSAAFGLGESETAISTVDADGVALAAIQGLYQLSQEQATRIQALEEENANLQGQLNDLEGRVTALEGGARTNDASAGPLSSRVTVGSLLFGGLLLVGLVMVQARRAGGRP